MSHTVKVIAGGLVLLALLLLVGRWIGPSPGLGMVKAARYFLPLWFVAAGINLWIGVAKAGYSVAEEAPIFLVVFGIPAVVALAVSWKLSQG
jgi:hypothetical protein